MQRIVFAVLALWLSVASTCLADGKVFGPVPARIAIPDQDAMIVWRDGMETLAIETRFTGPGREFAWVVPLPAAPEIKAATGGLFPSLRAMSAPRLDQRGVEIAPLCIVLSLALIVAMIFTRSPLKVAAITAGLLIAGVLLLLPALGKPRGGGSPAFVEVLDRRIVGSYETTTIASTDAAALTDWLRQNGFSIPGGAPSVVADYVKDGWVFAAAKLRRDDDTGIPCTPHPLVFTFKAAAPVYPLRLTAIDNGNLKVDLYVFGPGEAKTPGFAVQRCASVEVGTGIGGYFGGSPHAETIEVTHSAIAPLIAPGMSLTKLSADLTPERMRTDAVISFGKEVVYAPSYSTRSGAINRAFDAATLAFLLGIIFTALRSNTIRRRAQALCAALSIIAGLAVFAGVFVFTPKLEAAGEFRPTFWARHRMRSFAEELWVRADSETKRTGQRVSLEWARAEAKRILAEDFAVSPTAEGDSPGEYRVELDASGNPVMRFVDSYGREHILP